MRLPLDPRFEAAWDPVPRRHFDATLVRVATDEGITGYGSGDTMDGFSTFADLFIGSDPLRVANHVRVLETVSFHGSRFWPLEAALWDIVGKACGQPVATLFGGATDRLPAYASFGELRSPAARADAALAARLLSSPRGISDVDLEWILLQDRLEAPGAAQRPAGRAPGRMPRRLAPISVGAGTAVVAGVLAVGAAAAAVLNTVYAPTRVAPVQVSAGDIRAIENVTGIGTGQLPASGSRQLTFGQVSWSTAGGPQQVSSIARASAITGLAFPAPGTLPGEIGRAHV